MILSKFSLIFFPVIDNVNRVLPQHASDLDKNIEVVSHVQKNNLRVSFVCTESEDQDFCNHPLEMGGVQPSAVEKIIADGRADPPRPWRSQILETWKAEDLRGPA